MVQWKELDAKSYQEFLDTHKHAIVLFFSRNDIFTGSAEKNLQKTVDDFDHLEEIGRVEVDKAMGLFEKYEIHRIPCIMFFVEGEPSGFLAGHFDEDELKSLYMSTLLKLAERESKK